MSFGTQFHYTVHLDYAMETMCWVKMFKHAENFFIENTKQCKNAFILDILTPLTAQKPTTLTLVT